ncbi:SH3 type 3 domain protein [Calothrix sp. NIES-4101]|nr:SH3 type 3 domain protein [Calothrix sp. NIES-4101]
MKSNHTYRWRKLPVVSTTLLLAATIFVAPTFANEIEQTQGFESSSSERSGYLLAQVPASCRQVIARSGLRVREQPSINSRVIGTIQNNRNVTIQTDVNTNGWVPISTPLPGYVYAQYLGMCDTGAAPPPSSCRRIVASAGNYLGYCR